MNINQLETIEDLKKLFIWLNESIYRFVYVRCGYNRETAEDITQDIFIKAWEKRKQFNSKKSTLKNWIYIIARNHIIDLYRKKKGIISGYSDDIQEIIPVQSSSDDEEMIIETIMKSMDKLKEQEKEVIVLRYIQELEIEEIAKIINKNHIATKVMIHRAIKNLKDIVDKQK